METNLDLRSLLNDLIQTCRDGQEGFRTASENIDLGNVKRILNEYSLQRARFTGELQSASHTLGDSNPEYASSFTGTLHRGWINLKAALAGRDVHNILAECERGEDSAVGSYQEALKLETPANLRAIIERQYAGIQAAHDEVKALRDTYAPK
jgi:uncharacterized protein (TIGR02284 family)